ncbi:MAG: sigma-54 dependent transcriptional regulator [Calditrichia bacterium]
MKILIIDDEKSQRDILADILSDAGYEALTAEDGEKGLQRIYRDDVQLVLTDLRMPGLSGLEVLTRTLEYDPDIQLIIMTAYGTIPNAVDAIKKGAYDYLTKPFPKEDLLRVVKRAAEKASLVQENRRLKAEMSRRYSYHNLLGASAAMQAVFQLIEKIKNVDATVLITGESGTGKELAARAIHFSGSRKEGLFVAVNCGALPENLIESELFGYEKGAFTGAGRTTAGKFEQAQNGTIFLDEIGAMPLHLQVRLLRVLQEKQVQRLGGGEPIKLNVRVVAATNEDLPALIARQQFRQDLYHRLNVFTLELPPLRERPADIPLLARHFIKKKAAQYEKPAPHLTPEALQRLEEYTWPGNVRELENIIEKTILLTDHTRITPENLMMPLTEKPRPVRSDPDDEKGLTGMEVGMIKTALQQEGGSLKAAAEHLGISYKTLQYRLKKFGIDKKNFKK